MCSVAGRSPRAGAAALVMFAQTVLALDSSSSMSALAGFDVSSVLDAFLPPMPNKCIYYINLVPPFDVGSKEDCAAACLNFTGDGAPCISFNVCQQTRCGIQGYNKNWTILDDMEGCVAFQRIMPRNDTPATQAVPYKVQAPQRGVHLSGVLGQAFTTNIAYLTSPRSLDDLLYPYRLRHNGSYDGPGTIWGWDDFVPGSVASGWMMGAGRALAWQEVPQLRQSLDYLLQGIADSQDADGFALGFNEADTNSDFGGDNQNPSYVQSWFLHAMLEAYYGGGNDTALQVARKHTDWWNNCTYLPQLYPQDGGPDHWGPAPNGYAPTPNGQNPTGGTMSGAPFAYGHMLYWMNQAGIGHSRLALSPLGTQADVDFLVNLFQETWWLQQLAARVPQAIYARQWYPDNYEVTTLETYADLYLLTGQQLYLDAVLGGWALFRDPVQGWMFPGGSFSINENFVYPPGSFPLEFTGTDGWSESTRPTGEMCPSAFWTKLNSRLHRLDPDNETYVWEMERSIINVGLAAQAPNGTGVRYFAVMHKTKQAPTFQGTCCESQHTNLFSGIHSYVFSLVPAPAVAAEAQEAGAGVGAAVAADLAPAGKATTHHEEQQHECVGHDYGHEGKHNHHTHAHLHHRPISARTQTLYDGQPSASSSSSSSAFNGVYVDLVEPGSITTITSTGATVTVAVATAWPYDSAVTVSVTTSADLPAGLFDLALRMPSWVNASATGGVVPVIVSGSSGALSGTPGSYLHLTGQAYAAAAPTVISYALPMAWTVHPYTGVTQIAGYEGKRYAYSLGPFLMAAEGPWDNPTDCIMLKAGLDPMQPQAWLTPAPVSGRSWYPPLPGGATASLRFTVNGLPDYTIIPYFTIQTETELFATFPIIA